MSKKIMLNGVDYTGVYSIKGNAESAYRTGDVNITPANIGLGNVNNTADSEKSVKYATSAGSASSASKATGVVDYGETTKTIQIGYSGSGISGDEIKNIAGYTTGNGSDVNAKIKNVSKDALKSWLGLGSLAYSSATIPTIPSSLPANGGNSATVNGHTVNSDVPANAKFTDTTYGIATTTKAGIVKPDGTTITADEDGTLHGADTIKVDGITITRDDATKVIALAKTLQDKIGTIDNKVDQNYVVNNLTTTEQGFVLDGRQGKALQDQITSLNGSLKKLTIYSKTVTGTTSYDASFSTGLSCNSVIVLNAYTNDSDGGIEVAIVSVEDGTYYARCYDKLDGYLTDKKITIHIDYILRRME